MATQPYQSTHQPAFRTPVRPGASGTTWTRPAPPEDAAQILVVDDEPIVRETLQVALQSSGDQVLAVDSGESALAILGSGVFDLVILDVGLPGISGFETLRQIRARSDVPVMMVTAASTLTERVAGFDLGADDYLVKPLEIPELSRRVRAILRRSRGTSHTEDQLMGPDGIVMRLRSHSVTVGAEDVTLTPKEFAVLRLLLERRGEVINPDELSVKIWG
jgi:DNA-binding response OmpR family regulator